VTAQGPDDVIAVELVRAEYLDGTLTAEHELAPRLRVAQSDHSAVEFDELVEVDGAAYHARWADDVCSVVVPHDATEVDVAGIVAE